MKDSSINEADIWAYVAKNADTATQLKVERWKKSADYNADWFNSIVKLYELTGENPYAEAIDIEAQKSKFFDVVDLPLRKGSNKQKYLKYAAALILFVSVASVVYQSVSKNIITIETAYAEEKQIELSDGSVVWLNAASKISYKEESPRTITLDGEAFFKVAKDKTSPFTVETPDHVVVKALGTSFNVKAYPEDTYLETTLLTGKVAVSSKDYFEEKIIMLPNDHIKIGKANGIAVKTTIENQKTVLAWREGKIRFQNTSFKNIASDLRNQLNIKLVFANETIALSKFTASFDKTTPVEEILEVLKASKDFKYNLNQETNEWIIQ